MRAYVDEYLAGRVAKGRITEEQAVLLVALVAQLGHIVIDDRVLLREINNYHITKIKKRNT